jgi:periplasmic protein TonB
MPLRIPLPVALLLSVSLHAAALLPPLAAGRPRAVPPAPSIEVRLPVPDAVPEPLTDLSTRPTEPVAAPPPPPSAPVMARGRQLQRAQSALVRHLLYPPEAIAQGLEGDVILLLLLDADGRITGAEVARGSGHAVLDRAALDAARRIGALPGNPRQTLLPVRFRLD